MSPWAEIITKNRDRTWLWRWWVTVHGALTLVYLATWVHEMLERPACGFALGIEDHRIRTTRCRESYCLVPGLVGTVSEAEVEAPTTHQSDESVSATENTSEVEAKAKIETLPKRPWFVGRRVELEMDGERIVDDGGAQTVDAYETLILKKWPMGSRVPFCVSHSQVSEHQNNMDDADQNGVEMKVEIRHWYTPWSLSYPPLIRYLYAMACANLVFLAWFFLLFVHKHKPCTPGHYPTCHMVGSDGHHIHV